MHYHDPEDLKQIAELKTLAPDAFKGFVELDKIVGRDDGAIPRKFRELIAIAVACTTQCPYCLDVHTRAAKRAGATRQEVAEAALLAAGGTARAVDAIIAGEIDNGFAIIRPPGHHATPTRAMGFCLLNNIAINFFKFISAGCC